jgi:hypothetical protein
MFVLTVDQQGSQSGPDRVPALTRALEPCHLRLAPERTAGDEIQMLAEDADEALAAFLVILEEGGWSIGVGIGPERPWRPPAAPDRSPCASASRTRVNRNRRTNSRRCCA